LLDILRTEHAHDRGAATSALRRYELDRAAVGAPPVARICHESGGVVMSTRTVTVDEWARGLAADLVAVAGTNAAAIEVLRRLTS
jgi:hypothetical protein